MTSFLIVRHGESEWNVQGRWQGHADPPLTELGETQAAAAAQAVGAVDAIVASDLQRAARTAAIISVAIGVGPVMIDERLRERYAAEWQGLTHAEIEEQYPGFLAEGRRPEGYETNEAVAERVFTVLDQVAREQPDAAVLVVTHGGVIRALQLALEYRSTMLSPNLGGIVLEHDGRRPRIIDTMLLIDPAEVEVTLPGQI